MERTARVDTLARLRGDDPDLINQDAPRNISDATTLWRANTFQDNTMAGEALRQPTTSDTSRDATSLANHGRISSSASSNSKGSHKSHKGLKSILSSNKALTAPKAPKPKPYLLNHSCFSADGKTLYLWKPRERKVALLPIFEPHEILHTDVSVRPCGKALCVAGGSSKYLVVSQEESRDSRRGRVEVYSHAVHPSEAPATHVSLTLSSRNAFALARNDRLMATSTKNSLTIWGVPPGSETPFAMREISIPTPSSGDTKEVESQKTAFSADCQGVIVATRYMSGFVSVRTWNVQGESIQSASMNTTTGITHDYGLSSVFCDDARRIAVVTIMASEVKRVLLSLRESSSFTWPAQRRRFSYKITSAAQSPSGNAFVVATSDDRIFTFSLHGPDIQVSEVEGLCGSRSGCTDPAQAISLAHPDESTVYAFWFDEKGIEMKFASIKIEEDTKFIKTYYDIRSRFGYN